MIPLDASHTPAIEALLAARRVDAMFILSNLRAQGFGGDHPHEMRVWGDATAPSAVLGLTNAGMVLPFLPYAQHVSSAADVLRGRSLLGFAGPTSMVRPLLAVLGLDTAQTSLSVDEPQFLLDLADMTVPDGPGTLAPLTADPETAARWRQAYNEELHVGHPGLEAARADVDRYIAADSHRFLMIDGAPSAMTGFNATLPEIVQIGGVYTPPETRGRSLARRAVALHLVEAQGRGVTQATLAAASDAAVACYRPLGFGRVGEFTLLFFAESVTP